MSPAPLPTVRHWQRLNVKPGLTGEWQVHGRLSVKDFEEVVDLDLRYQTKWHPLIETYNSTTHHNVIWNIIGGKDSFYLVAGSPRGYSRVFNNTFIAPVALDKSVEARNNIFAASASVAANQQSNNLFVTTDPKFSKASVGAPKTVSGFTLQPNSPAIDAGMGFLGLQTALLAVLLILAHTNGVLHFGELVLN